MKKSYSPVKFSSFLQRFYDYPSLELPEKEMALYLVEEDKRVEETRPIGEHKFPSDIIVEAAREFIQYREQLKILELFGTIDYDETYDYKKQRQQR